MNELAQHTFSIFLGFFAIMNPIANTAVFIGLTGDEEQSVQIKTALRALVITFCIVCTFAVLGNVIFQMFGITLLAFKITGGILVFIIGYQMIHGESSAMHKAQDNEDKDLAVSPLAVPILAGPGTIATAMNFSATGSRIDIIITIAMFALLCIITFFCFIFGQKIVKLIGNSGISIITRLMGLILAVIGIQMLIAGIAEAINTFAK